MDRYSPTRASSVQLSSGVRPLSTVSPGGVIAGLERGEGRRAGLSQTEIRRRLLHMTPGLLPFLLWVIPHQDPWGPLLADIAIAVTATIVASALVRFNTFGRPGENDWRSSVLGYALPVLATLGLCRGREEIGVMTLAILAFGDGSATLGGLLLGGAKLPWNQRKSWTGMACFIVCGTVMATLTYWGESRPGIPFATAALIAAGTTIPAAFMESLPVRINDNLRVGATAAVLGGAWTLLLVG
jgi:phytol kinase